MDIAFFALGFDKQMGKLSGAAGQVMTGIGGAVMLGMPPMSQAGRQIQRTSTFR